MGPVRGTLTLLAALLPGPALARACDTLRPGWDGTPSTALAEALHLFASPAALLLLAATAIVLRFRSQWGGVAVCVGWSLLVSAVTFFDLTGGQRAAAMAEGCIGRPTLFIAAVAAICVATILYTAPRPARD